MSDGTGKITKPLWGADPEELWSLYRKSSMITGKPPKPEQSGEAEESEVNETGGGLQQAYSLWWLFARRSFQDLEDAGLARAFLGDRDAWETIQAACKKQDAGSRCDRSDYIGSDPPNDRQWEAIETALKNPISFIQGPPGTGKTATIINLIYQIATQKSEKKTVVVVSSNNSALENIHDKLLKEMGSERATQVQRDKAAAMKLRVAKLGGTENRKLFYTDTKFPYKDLFPQHREQRYYFQDPSAKGKAAWQTEEEALEALPPCGGGVKRRRELWRDQWIEAHPDGTLQAVTRECGVTPQDFFRTDPPAPDDQARRGERFFPHPGFIAFTTTVNSLPNCFRDGLFYQYDYIIMDEASQMGMPSGLLAMCHAKHLVLVGDEQQLAPVVSERALAPLDNEFFGDAFEPEIEDQEDMLELLSVFSEEYTEELASQIKEDDRLNLEPYETEHWKYHWKYYLPQPEVSFLDLCLSVFLGKEDDARRWEGLIRGAVPKVFLDQHYRCHPGIIRFCNESVYIPAGTPLKYCTTDYDKGKHIPIKVLQFQGDYCEHCYRSAKEGNKGPGESFSEAELPMTEDPLKELVELVAATGQPVPPAVRPGKPSKRNLRQVELFMEEEWPELLKRLEGDESFSVCILSPFKGQLDALKQAILAAGQNVAEGKAEPEKQDVTILSLSIDNAAKKEKEKGPAPLTIHKSQGQEFDVVYLLPVEDGAWENPFSQKKRMVNVAVSRAKKELRIITSTKYMDLDEQTSVDQGELYLKKLVQYVQDNATARDKAQGFGLHDTALRSLFDAKQPSWKGAAGSEQVSAGQQEVEKALAEIVPQLGLSWSGKTGAGGDREVPVADVLEQLEGPEFRSKACYKDFLKYIKNEKTSFDCIVRDRDGIPILAIEVDGAYHRFPWQDKDLTLDEQYQRWRKRWLQDLEKDLIVEALGGTVYNGNRKKILRGKEQIDQWAQSAGRFALLRLSDDGTTLLETDALRASAPQNLADKFFTIQDLIRKYLPEDKDALSLTMALKLWTPEELNWLKLHLPKGKVLVSRVQSQLQELGLLTHTTEGWQATSAGQALGIRKRSDPEKKGFYPVYPPYAQANIKKLLLEEMKTGSYAPPAHGAKTPGDDN